MTMKKKQFRTQPASTAKKAESPPVDPPPAPEESAPPEAPAVAFPLDEVVNDGISHYVLHLGVGEPQPPHNPNGLSIKGACLELDEALQGSGCDARLFRHVIDNEAGDGSADPRPAALAPSADATPMQKLKARMARETDSWRQAVYRKYFTATPDPKHLLQPGDDELAALIAAAPEALLASFQAQDAGARWTYAKAFSGNAETRNQAQAHLDTAAPKRRGKPPKVSLDPRKLLQAYDDFCGYCRAVFEAADDISSRKPVPGMPVDGAERERELERWFPEVRELELHGVVIADLLNPRYNKPAPSEVATSFIAAFSGLSESRITDLIGAARNAAKSNT